MNKSDLMKQIESNGDDNFYNAKKQKERLQKIEEKLDYVISLLERDNKFTQLQGTDGNVSIGDNGEG